MSETNHDISLDLNHLLCQACIMKMPISSVPSGNNIDYLCNHHSSYIKGQQTSQDPLDHPKQAVAANGDFDLHTNLAPLSIIDSESSSDSHNTLKAVRADLSHILGQDYHTTFDPNKLTESTMRAFDYSHGHAYPLNTFGWAHDKSSYNAPMTDSMLAMRPAKKSSSSINTTSWYFVEKPGEEQYHATDKDVFAAGAQYENDTAYPYTIDEAIMGR